MLYIPCTRFDILLVDVISSYNFSVTSHPHDTLGGFYNSIYIHQEMNEKLIKDSLPFSYISGIS